MHDEEEVAERCSRRLCAELRRFSEHRTALIVVDDASRDATPSILSRLGGLSDCDRLTVLTHTRNAGYGGAIKTGASRAARDGFDYVLFMDSDLTNDPSDIGKFVAKMRSGFDVIKASRYCRGSAVIGVPWWRRLISAVGNQVASLLYGRAVRDCTNGFRAIRVELLARMNLVENGFAVILEELYQARLLGATFAEIPYTLTARPRHGKPSSFAYRPRVFYLYLKYAIFSGLGHRRCLEPAVRP
jgi:dolichol-phosphate mannosyltransferase